MELPVGHQFVKNADFIISITRTKTPRLPRKLKKWLNRTNYGNFNLRFKRPKTNTALLKRVFMNTKLHITKVRRGHANI